MEGMRQISADVEGATSAFVNNPCIELGHGATTTSIPISRRNKRSCGSQLFTTSDSARSVESIWGIDGILHVESSRPRQWSLQFCSWLWSGVIRPRMAARWTRTSSILFMLVHEAMAFDSNSVSSLSQTKSTLTQVTTSLKNGPSPSSRKESKTVRS